MYEWFLCENLTTNIATKIRQWCMVIFLQLIKLSNGYGHS